MRRWLSVGLLLVGTSAAAQGTADSAEVVPLLAAFRRLQPDAPVRVVVLDAPGFQALVARRLGGSPAVQAERARAGALADEISAAELWFRPVLGWSTGHDRYATYDRPAVVRARIPIAWDEDDPVQADINLPNGGRGLIWLPRPTDYADRDVIVHASRAYASELSRGSVGLSKAYPSGLQLSVMNLAMSRRWAPTTYTHPWSMSVGNSIELPLLRGAGGSGMVATLDLRNQREEARVAAVTLRGVELEQEMALLRALADLRTGWDMYRSAVRRAGLLEQQLADVSLLRDRLVVTAYELVRIREAVQDAREQRDALSETFVLATLTLSQSDAAGDTLELFIPGTWDADQVAARLTALARPVLLNAGAPPSIERLPGVRVALARLQQARNQQAYARSQQRPQLSLHGSLDLFQSDDMGYRTSGQAFERAFMEPDGLVWNVGITGSVPLGRENRARGDAATKRVRAAEADLAQTRRDLRETARQLAVRVRAASDRLRAARAHLQGADSLASAYARPLYEARRLTRAEFASFAADVEAARIDWLAAWRDHVNVLLDLATFTDSDLGPFVDALR